MINREYDEASVLPPSDVVDLASIMGAHGVRGQIKLKLYNPGSSLLRFIGEWWLHRAGSSWKKVNPISVKISDQFAIVQLDGLGDREKAQELKGSLVGISRSKFPQTFADEYYWVDLVSMSVFNLQQIFLGEVINVFHTGASAVLCVKNKGINSDAVLSGCKKENAFDSKKDLLIPFVANYVINVDQLSRRILVDWQCDY